MGDLPRVADEKALHLGAALTLQEKAFAFGFHAFREHGDIQSFPKTDDGADNLGRLPVALHAGDESPIDLDLVELERLQRRERCVAGAEIVHGDPDP